MAEIPTIPREMSITSSTYDTVSALEAASAVRQARRTLTRASERAYNKRTGARAAHVKRVVNAAMISAIVKSRTPETVWVIVKYMEVGKVGKVLVDNGYRVWQELDFDHTGTDHFVRLIAVKGAM